MAIWMKDERWVFLACILIQNGITICPKSSKGIRNEINLWKKCHHHTVNAGIVQITVCYLFSFVFLYIFYFGGGDKTFSYKKSCWITKRVPFLYLKRVKYVPNFCQSFGCPVDLSFPRSNVARPPVSPKVKHGQFPSLPRSKIASPTITPKVNYGKSPCHSQCQI